MIYTCTLNPSIDYLIDIEKIQLGALNRATKSAFYPGGKGINVSRVLKNLDVESTALGFIGGFTGEFIQESLTELSISHNFIKVKAPTRVNVKVKTDVETEINGQGTPIPERKVNELFSKISLLNSNDFLILAGSLPLGISTTFYEEIASLCQEKNIRFVLDTSGKALGDALKYGPFLVKPNEHELGDLFQTEIKSIKDATHYGKELLGKGPENVIVSLGAKGALFINKEVTFYASVPKGELKSSVGAGDSLVAGFVAAFVNKPNFFYAFQYGIAAGSATAFSKNLCTKSSVEELLPQITIEKINN